MQQLAARFGLGNSITSKNSIEDVKVETAPILCTSYFVLRTSDFSTEVRKYGVRSTAVLLSYRTAYCTSRCHVKDLDR